MQLYILLPEKKCFNVGLTCPFGELLLPPTFSVFGLVLLICGGLTSSLHILAQLS